MRGRPFQVLAVNVADGEPCVRQFLTETPLQLPVLLDRDGDTQRAWELRGLPATFVLDGDGVIWYRYLGELDWAQPAVVRTVETLLLSAR
jgi:hypothetical protein